MASDGESCMGIRKIDAIAKSMQYKEMACDVMRRQILEYHPCRQSERNSIGRESYHWQRISLRRQARFATLNEIVAKELIH